MVLTGAQTTSFFEDNDQMGLAHRTRVFLQSEGITDVDDLEEFVTKDSWNQVLENCKRPPRIPDPAGGGGLVEDQAYRIGAKSLRRLKIAAGVQWREIYPLRAGAGSGPGQARPG